MQCQRCAAPPDPGVCLFCQEASSDTYVPRHLNHEAAALESDPSSLLLASSATGGIQTAPGADGNRFVDSTGGGPYVEALSSHRGCRRCWERWETQQLDTAGAGGGHPEMAVRCPVCGVAVDIRRCYEEVLCASCQRAVVPSPAGLDLVFARQKARLASICGRAPRIVAVGLMLCLTFSIQSALSFAIWCLFSEQVGSAAGSALLQPNPSQGGAAGPDSAGLRVSGNASALVNGALAAAVLT